MRTDALNRAYPYIRAFGEYIRMCDKSILIHQEKAIYAGLEETVVLALGEPIYLGELSPELQAAVKAKAEAIRETFSR